MSTSGELTAQIVTARGTIHLRLFPEKTPMTVANFVNLGAAQILRWTFVPPGDS